MEPPDQWPSFALPGPSDSVKGTLRQDLVGVKSKRPAQQDGAKRVGGEWSGWLRLGFGEEATC